MKKRNFLFYSAFLFFGLIFSSVFLAACKSLPQGNDVSAIELLDDESSFYIAIPKSADYNLIVRVIENNTGLSEHDSKMLADRIQKVYCGLNRSKNHIEIQIAVDGSIPQKYISSALKPKNGWTVEKYTVQNSGSIYPLYTYDGMTFAFPSEKVACLGRDVKKMVDTYDSLFSYIPMSESENEDEIKTPLDSELYDFLENAESEIRFCANKPQSFLTLLTGAQLDLKLIDVYGAFVQDPKLEKQYLLNLTFNFKNETYLKAGRTLLTLAFGLTNSQSIVIGTNTLQINGIKIDKNQLYKLLVI